MYRLQAETPRRNQKLSAFAFSIRFTSTRSPTRKDGSLERSLGDDKAIDVQQEHVKRYLSFSPKAVHRSLFEQQGSSSDWHPVAAQVFAAVLFADISGFTRLSARLGADHLKAHIKYVLLSIPTHTYVVPYSRLAHITAHTLEA